MKKNILFLIFFLLISVVNQISFAKDLDRIVAVVNNQIIAASELAQEEAEFKKQLDPHSSLAKSNPKELQKKILQQLINEKLQLQLASQRGIYVNEKALDAAITNIAKRNQLSLTQFKNALKNHGVGYLDFRERIRKQMLLSKLQQAAIGDAAQVSDQEVDEFLRDKHAVAAVLQEYHLKKLSKDQARMFLYENKLKKQVDIWLEKLRSTAYIKINTIN